MDFLITDREGIERGVLVKSSYAVISIHDPDKRPPRIRKQSGLKATLVLAFDDAEEIPGDTVPGEIVLMSRDQAERIRRFVEKHRSEVGAVVVHCEQACPAAP